MTEQPVVLALDAMGGDNAPYVVIAGAELSLTQFPDTHFLFFGDTAQIEPIIAKFPRLAGKYEIIHTDAFVRSDEKPSVALRKGKQSSMRLAIDAVARGEANAIISAGNTGALMVMGKMVLKMLPGIDRPAIISVFPARNRRSAMLDLGANVECNSDNLYQFAVMGHSFARIVLNVEKPTIGLLNIGSEEVKGHEVLQVTADLLRKGEFSEQFHGYIEGTDVTDGTVDVVVTDGFSGNIALKTAEGTANLCKHYLQSAFNSSWLAKLGGLLAKGALKKSFQTVDPRLHNGAMLIGLNGILVKSHGNTDEVGFANAIAITNKITRNAINEKITTEISLQGVEDNDEG